MVTGVSGSNGLAAPRHVDLEKEADQETVTTHPQLMEAATAKGLALSLEIVVPTLVQVFTVCLDHLIIVFVKVNGSWGGWKGWSHCSKTCGSGKRSRSRDCNNPAPAYGGRNCQGSSIESGACNTNPCPGKQYDFIILLDICLS